MTEAKTYYGPWSDGLPKDPPDGSIWECVENNHTSMLVAWDGSVLIANASTLTACRRVYPPGSVLPEPRPLVVDGEVRDLSKSKWWMASVTRFFGEDPIWTLFSSAHFMRPSDIPFAMLHKGNFCYPVQPLNGAFVPIPWHDSGCTTE